jgi:uncharacterized protein YxeA
MKLFLLLIIIILAFIISLLIKANEKRKVEMGKGNYFVVVAPSGRGTVYHSKNCRRVRAYVAIPEREALRKGYHPCASCGGHSFYQDY